MSTPARNRPPRPWAAPRGVRPLLRVLGVSAAIAFAAGPALACPCSPPGPAEALRAASAVFEGTVAQLDPQDGGSRAQLRITRSWKGPEHETLTVFTPRPDECGLSLVVGSAYLIYAGGPADALRADRCGGSKPMLDAQTDLNVIGIGAVPVDPPSEEQRPASAEPPAAGGCASCRVGGRDVHSPALGSSLAVLFAVQLARRRRRRLRRRG